jgi:hypothetical protein
MAELKDFPRLNTYPAEYTGGPTIKNPDGSIPHETKGVYVYNNVIRSNKGAASFLTFPSLQYSYKPEVYEAFLNKEYKGDSNTYLNPAVPPCSCWPSPSTATSTSGKNACGPSSPTTPATRKCIPDGTPTCPTRRPHPAA